LNFTEAVLWSEIKSKAQAARANHENEGAQKERPMIALKLKMEKRLPDRVLKQHFLERDKNPLGKQKEKYELRQAISHDSEINLEMK
jgi:hypothetical protein